MDRISKLNAEVMRYYHSLLEKKGKEAKVFLNKINIGEETIDNFNLGYSGTDLNGLVYHFNSLGFDDFIFEMWQAEFDDNYEPEDVFLFFYDKFLLTLTLRNSLWYYYHGGKRDDDSK